ncbi:MAG TPA: 5'-methylthioadenosine/S-adenosylhomocysteine nucleosidase [Anaerolineaceae bacterium]|nr:5'-methylthioadenosine/S-adenosylhomocysteine nucleosidase [Anaerolineaceae bacterium]
MKRLLLLLILLLLGCRPAPAPPSFSLDPTPRLAILSAFDAELARLLSQATDKQTTTLNGRTVTTARLAGQDVLLAPSGESMVNAAMTAQAVLDHFTIRAILFSGIAGGVNPELSIGDVVIPAHWGEYQEQRFARQKGDGWDPGGPAPFRNFGMMFPQKVGVTRAGATLDREEETFWFEVDPKMLESARKVAETVQLDSCPTLGACLSRAPKVVVGGNGVSGPTFVDNAEYRQWVWTTFHADALDMETAAVAHVAYTNGVPFLAFRSLSDLAGGGPGANEVVTFFQLAADNSARVVMAFLEAWK